MDDNFDLFTEIKDIRSVLKAIDKRLEGIEKDFLNIEETKESYDNTIWNDAKGLIKKELTEISYNTWIEPIKQIKFEEEVIYLQVSNDFSQSILETRYMDLIKNALHQVIEGKVSVQFVIEKD